MTKNRREFLQSLIAVGASVGLIPLAAACGDDSGGGDTGTGDTGTPPSDTGTGDTGTPPADTGTGDTGTPPADSSTGDTGSMGDGGGDGGGGMCESTSAEIGTNHGHAVMIPAADVNAGAEMTYSIQGTSGHDHEITLTAADMTSLQGGGTVMVTSTTGASHTHEVTVMCGA
jgi:hypothetical protein